MPQVFINEIFKDLINRYVITYINDMLIYFASYDDHVHHIRMVLSRLLQHHLYVKAEKFIRIPSCSSGISSRRGEWRWTPASVGVMATLAGGGTPPVPGFDGPPHPGVSLQHQATEPTYQARWALFFISFQFSVKYWPGTKNGNADGLSHCHDLISSPTVPEPILPSSVLLAPIRWDLMEEIQQAQVNEFPPPSCPPTKLYVPTSLPQLLWWVHGTPSSGHTGIHRTVALIRNRFWWPSLLRDLEEFIESCATCAQSQTSCQLPTGLLEPLPIPRRLWSHMSVNCVTDLPEGGGVRMSRHVSASLALSTGVPQGCVLSRLLYSLYMYDCVATTNSTTVIKFADDTVVVGLISDNNETAYLEEIRNVENWCQRNNLILNVSKTKELIVDFSTKQERNYHTPVINESPVERVNSFRYIDVHIMQDLSWSCHINTMVKKARQRLYHLRCLRDFRLPSKVLRKFYSCTIESILMGNIAT
ncbi:hypothetical protein QTP86_012089 [Hemibagrus guttatus]|nr:hypothetical protein QTP86_012089 [Hemibagrus guttatus]